jgi:hypothetical protein
MGQRLVITIKEGGKNIAAGYWHWSAYTASSIEAANKVLEFIKSKSADIESYKTHQRFAADALLHEEDGVSFENTESYKIFFGTDMPEDYGQDRNSGVVCLDDAGIASLREWAEGSVDIDITDLANLKILFDVFWTQSIEEYAENYPGVLKAKDVNASLAHHGIVTVYTAKPRKQVFSKDVYPWPKNVTSMTLAEYEAMARIIGSAMSKNKNGVRTIKPSRIYMFIE